MSQPLIELRHVTRIYSLGDTEVRALDDVSLTIAPGEFIAIMGSSGSGKSTLMNVCGCLDQPTAGQYLFEGVDLAHLKEPELARIRSERIGFVFQNFNLLARTSALENTALPLFYATSGPAGGGERFERARAALEQLGLSGREHSSPNQLSGGQQQRVAIARALINHPGLLLADEPTGNLDTRTSHEIMQTLRTLNRQQAVTVVVVTHERDIADYADRVITMRDGKILTDEARSAPAAGEISAPERAMRPGLAPLARQEAQAAGPEGRSRRIAPWLGFAGMILMSAAQAVGRNKLRSALTTLGVFIGVAALIAMVAVGQGANQAVEKQIESLGTNLLVVLPGATTASGARVGFGSASTLTAGDAQALRREDPAVGDVGYMIRQLSQVEYGSQNWTTNVQGATPSYLRVTNWQIAAGRTLGPSDEGSASMVALLGQTVYQQLFNAYENPIGARILVKGQSVRVVGLLSPKGQSSYGQDQDDVVIVPFTAAEEKILGVAAPSQAQTLATTTVSNASVTVTTTAAAFPPAPNPYNIPARITGYVNSIYVQAASKEAVTTALQQVTDTLLRRHHIRPGDTADFAVRNLSQVAQTAETSSRIMALLLAVVASISLLVGGIGIMNILLVSVTERTREIGLRMAIGARRLHVLLQFLMEAIFLSVAGGVAGILGGIGVSALISAVAHWPTLLPGAAVVGGFVFSAAVGIFFGYYPARKASHLNPIEALRYE
ncbi:MAG TPA: ABC transporter permease [Steroidobacteraceae bacterium]|nr:ABC transporter permease [Steroidobacteraceae bacterium]